MADAGTVTVKGVPQLLKVMVLVSPFVVMTSLTGSTWGAAVRVSRALMELAAPLGVVFQSRMYSLCPPIVAVLARVTSAAGGRMVDGRDERVFSVARAWYSFIPALIPTQ